MGNDSTIPLGLDTGQMDSALGMATKSFETFGKGTSESFSTSWSTALDVAKSGFKTFASVGKTAIGSIVAAIPFGFVIAGFNKLFDVVGDGFKEGIHGAAEEEAALKRVENQIRSTGGVAGVSADDVASLAREMQNASVYGEDLQIAASGILLQFKNIRGDQFKGASQAVNDLAEFMDGNLAGAAERVGQMLNDPLSALTKLRKEGIVFTQSQKGLIEQMIATGDVMGAQNGILNVLNSNFGGAAKAATQTWTGVMTQLRNVMGDVWEAVSGLLFPAVQKIIPVFTAVASAIPPIIDTFATMADGVSEAVIPAFDWLFESMSAAWDMISTALTPALEVATGVLMLVGEQVIAVAGKFVEWYSVIKDFGSEVSSILQSMLSYVVDGFMTAFATIQVVIENWRDVAVLAVLEFQLAIVKTMGVIQHFFGSVLPGYFSWFAENWQSILHTAVDYLSTVLINMGTNIRGFIDSVYGWISGDGWDFEWTALEDGFRASITKLPEIAERTKSDLEQALEGASGEIAGNLGDKIKKQVETNKSAVSGLFGDLQKIGKDALGGMNADGTPKTGTPGKGKVPNAPFDFSKDGAEDKGNVGGFEDLMSLNKRIQSSALKSPEATAVNNQTNLMKAQHIEQQQKTAEVVTAVKDTAVKVADAVKGFISNPFGAVVGP